MGAPLNELVVNTSALIAMLRQEPEAERSVDLAAQAAVAHLRAASRVELGWVSEGSRHRVEDTEVEQLFLSLSVRVVPFGQRPLHWALQGWRRYWQGAPSGWSQPGGLLQLQPRHGPGSAPAVKGDDFAHTDVKAAFRGVASAI